MTRKRPSSPRTTKKKTVTAPNDADPAGAEQVLTVLTVPDADTGSVGVEDAAASAAPESDTSPAPEPELEAESEAESGPSRPPIEITLDTDLSGGFAHARFDVMVRGRVVSPAPIEEIRLECDGWASSVASYGQHDRAAAAAMADGTPARMRAFRFNLPRSGSGKPENCAFRIVARTEDGLETFEDYVIDVDPAAGDPVRLVSGSVRPGAGAGRSHEVVYLERATIDAEGLLTVTGWAVALAPILAVQISADDERIAKARFGGEREDVGVVFPSYPNSRLSGFNLTLQLEEVDRDTTRISAQAVCPNGFGHTETIPVERLIARAAPRPQRTVLAADAPGIPEKPIAAAAPAPSAAPVTQQSFSLLNQRPTYQLQAAFRIEDDPMFGLVLPGITAGRQPTAAAPATVAEASVMPAQPAPELSANLEMFCDQGVLTSDGNLSVSGWAVCGIGILQVRVLLDERDIGRASFGHERPDVGEIFPKIEMAAFSGFRFDGKIADRISGEHIVRIVVRNLRGDEKDEEISVTAREVAEPEPIRSVAPPEVLSAEQAEEFRFELDAPATNNDVAVAVVTGRLTIEGWLLSRTGIAAFEVFIDGERAGDVHHGLARQDVGAAFPEWPNSLRAGYAFHCPPRSLRDGDRMVELRVRANSGVELTRRFAITVKKSEDTDDAIGIRRRVPRIESDMLLALLDACDVSPSVRFILRLPAPVDPAELAATLETLRLQAFDRWSVLVLAADAGIANAARAAIDDRLPAYADRFTVTDPSDQNAWAAPLIPADEADQVIGSLLLPGDRLGADAALELALATARSPAAELVYGDEMRVSPVSNSREPFFKPDFSPDLLYSTNYIGRPWSATGRLLAKVGATPASLFAAGEYDLLLRCCEQAESVHHLPKMLADRGHNALDTPAQERAALESMLVRLDTEGEVLDTAIAGTYRVKRAVASRGKVSIIIPTCAAHGYIETCIGTLRAKTSYPDYEIICIDNIPESGVAWKVWLQQNADKVVDMPHAFNWSRFNNSAVDVADGEFLLFLNDDIEIIQEDWLEAMLEHACRPEVGLVGPQLLYRDGKVQHAGMFLASPGIGRHAFRFAAKDDPCYFGLALTQRNVMAVTGACMLMRRTVFEDLGRFDEAHEIVNNDLDLCLRAHRAGLLTVFTPYATLIHYELASRANLKDVFDLTHFNAAWKTMFAAGDPYFNPRMSRHADDYRPDDEAVQWVVSGAPLFHPEEIKKILVVKLDHIGDFVTALPPIRRLKHLFPHAEITVLAGPASRAFVSLEPCIDAFIPFAFFHARSQLGERELTEDDYAGLAATLEPHHFDLAVDLRKHVSTRDVLKHAGARFLAGFDYLGQFPFLDIALDWDGDRTLQRKRSHIVDDLLALVNAIGHAAEGERTLIQPTPEPLPLDALPAPIRALFQRPVVAIHPGAGNITKQWPAAHFSALIDLMIERKNVAVMLVGGPDDVPVAEELIANTQHPDWIGSMAGKAALADLPRLLRNCVLYIGNDSGPKHIAAAVAVPTIGIHSGVVDPVEWGPIGPSAVALRRNMTCSPCYLAKAEDCPRALACLTFLEPNLVYETVDLLLPRTADPVITADADAVDPVEAAA